MRLSIACVVAFLVSAGAKLGTAQVTLLPTPPPQVTAASANWLVNGEPIFYAGEFYYRTGPDVFFDGNVMKRTGVYGGVPLYEDSTLEPYSIVYVPVGRNLMRPYERRRAGQLAGTVGSRTPSFPIERDVEVSVAAGRAGGVTPSGETERRVVSDSPRAVGTTGLQGRCEVEPIAPCGSVQIGSGGVVRTGRQNELADRTEARPESERLSARASLESIPAPSSNAGVWVELNGSRWYLDGRAVPYEPEQFIATGLYHGFPVYQKRGGPDGEIYIQSVEGGLVAPFRRR
jgi:hypothetical protein